MTQAEKQKVKEMRINGAGYVSIASAIGISINTVKSFCRRNGLQGSSSAAAANLKIAQDNALSCRQCGRRLVQKKKHRPKKFCSDKCRLAWWNSHPDQVNRRSDAVYRIICAHCGRGFDSYGNKNRKFCSHSCYIKHRFGE